MDAIQQHKIGRKSLLVSNKLRFAPKVPAFILDGFNKDLNLAAITGILVKRFKTSANLEN